MPINTHFDFGKQLQDDNAVSISMQAKNNTNKNALFLQPIRFTEFKYYSQRSSFVDYKIPVHRKTALAEWYKRLTIIKMNYFFSIFES
jgi:hypothetical protein